MIDCVHDETFIHNSSFISPVVPETGGSDDDGSDIEVAGGTIDDFMQLSRASAHDYLLPNA